jgi:hypothetical protein
MRLTFLGNANAGGVVAAEFAPDLRFYDDRVRDCLSELAGPDSPDPIENLEALFSDSNLDEVLAGGAAYGDPVDSYLRRIWEIARGLDPSARGALFDDPEYRECQLLAAKALKGLEGRPMGTLVGNPLQR